MSKMRPYVVDDQEVVHEGARPDALLLHLFPGISVDLQANENTITHHIQMKTSMRTLNLMTNSIRMRMKTSGTMPLTQSRQALPTFSVLLQTQTS